ncbi:MAG TPA: sulfotransferase family 2 domain-containing protein [Rhizomicrobium sp.]
MAVTLIPHRQPASPNPRSMLDVRNKLILFWMHRCGSTTAQLWFFELAGWKERMAGRGAGELSRMWFAEHEHDYGGLQECYRDPSYLKIAVVRHPLPRAISAFTVMTDSKTGLQWRVVARSVAAPDAERRLTFLEFLDFLEQTDLATANYHWRLQTAQDWCDLSLPDIQFVRLESIRAGLNDVCRKLGRKRIPVWLNSAQTKIRSKFSGEEIVNFTRADFAREFGTDRRGVIRFPDYGSFLTPHAAERLARLYARDFTALGYDPNVIPTEEANRPTLWQRAMRRLSR